MNPAVYGPQQQQLQEQLQSNAETQRLLDYSSLPTPTRT